MRSHQVPSRRPPSHTSCTREYVASLRDAGLDRTPLGAAWIAAGERALEVPSAITIPNRGDEHFTADSPRALTYRVELRRGQTYRLSVGSAGRSVANLFIDVFRVEASGPPQRVASTGPPSRALAFEPSEDDTFIVRVQPELLASGAIERDARAPRGVAVSRSRRRTKEYPEPVRRIAQQRPPRASGHRHLRASRHARRRGRQTD